MPKVCPYLRRPGSPFPFTGRFLLLVLLALSGCHGNQQTPVGPEKHLIRGQIMAVDQPMQSVLLAHEAVPGLMPAMTMEYKVADPAVLGEVHRGDRITADLLNDRDAAGPTHLRLADVVVTAQARPDPVPAVQYHVPTAGEDVPDFSFLNQSDKKISLAQFKGKVLLLTFVYTRCPLPEFCIRMSRNFAEIDRKLQADPGLYAKTHLLTISFDPAYDTPKVLRSYGGAYTGKYSQETFQHWDFAAPSEAELPKVEHWFDVGVTPAGQQLQHSLATAIIGADGKVVAFYPTNDWSVDEALKAIRGAVS
jgi:protein SCO1